jgi:hypothetical protein
MELVIIILSKISQVQKDKGHVFSLMWKIDPKDNYIHKYKHDHIHTYIESMFAIFNRNWGRRERKREWERMILKYIAFV